MSGVFVCVCVWMSVEFFSLRFFFISRSFIKQYDFLYCFLYFLYTPKPNVCSMRLTRQPDWECKTCKIHNISLWCFYSFHWLFALVCFSFVFLFFLFLQCIRFDYEYSFSQASEVWQIYPSAFDCYFSE